MSDHTDQSNNELGLSYLLGLIRHGWRSILIGGALGVGVALLLMVLMAPTYQAQAVVRIGTVAEKPLEPASTTVERINTPAFRLEVAKESNDLQLLQRLSRGAGKGKFVDAALIRNTQLVSLVVYGPSPEQAGTLGDLVISALQQRHESLGAAMVEKLNKDIVLLRAKLNQTERELAELTKARAAEPTNRGQASAFAVLLTNLQLEKQGEIADLRKEIAEMEFTLLSPATLPTATIEPIFVGKDPVSPRLIPLLMVGTLAGLLIGMGVVVVQDFRTRRAGRDRVSRV